MHVIADTESLRADGVIDADAAREIERRARATMVRLGIDMLLCLGIVLATAGLIAFLASPVAIAGLGGAMLAAGAAVLARTGRVYAMFGNAAALIGAGLLLGGAGAELAINHPDIAGLATAALGFATAMLCAAALLRGPRGTGFVSGAVGLAGLGMHLGGVFVLLVEASAGGVVQPLFWLYAAASIALAGWLTDIRLVTALALPPFAQALDTGTVYFHAAYVFVSPEPTLTILQMGLLATGALWLAGRRPERTARHARLVATLAFVIANLCALVGSLWGDVVGETILGPDRNGFDDFADYSAARDVFLETALAIHEHVFSVVWAVALIAVAAWAAHGARRGLFNTAVTFGAIHAYTQAFETFYDQPLAYVVGGLASVPLAWGFWRLDGRFMARRARPEPQAGQDRDT